MGQILPKPVFLHKISHTQLYYAFLVFWNIFAEIDWNVHFWVKKLPSQKEAKNYSESNIFLNKFEMQKSRGKIFI